MIEVEESLEEKVKKEKAKKFFRLEIIGKFGEKGFNPIDIENLSEYISEINYLIKKNYVTEVGETVKSLHYVPNSVGREWALS